MEPEAAGKLAEIETTVQELARLLARHVEASDTRLTRIEQSLLKLSDSVGSSAAPMHEFANAAGARLARVEERAGTLERNLGSLQQELGALRRAGSAGGGHGQPKG